MPDTSLATRRQPRDSLATKIIFFVFFSTFVTALVVSWISVHSTYGFLRAHLDAAYAELVERGEERLLGALADGQERLGQIARTPATRAMLGGDPAARAPLEKLLAAHPVFSALTVTDASGAVVASASVGAASAPPLPHEPLVETPALRAAGTHLVASTPVRDAEGTVRGSLHGRFALGPLASHLVAARGSETRPLFLLDGTGRVLAASEPPGALPFESFPAELIAAEAGRPSVEFRGADGQRGIGTRRPLPLGDWSLAAAEPLEAAFAPVFSVVTHVFVIDLAIILVFSFLAYEITAKIVRPLEALSEGARRISQGELEVEVQDTRTHDEIGLLTRTFNDMARRLRRNREEIEHQHDQLREQNDELQRANEVLEQLSITDGLTKLHNHRYFQETLTREIKRVSRSGEPLAILLIDIDDFKALNDRHGHAEGDAVLERIARVLNECVRESDVLARYGGEEFVVLATGTDLEGAVRLAEKVRSAVSDTVFLLHESLETMHVTVSIGVAEFGNDRKHFFQAADRALYRAKAGGKNCVIAAEPEERV